MVIDSANHNPVDRSVVGLVIKSNLSDTSYSVTNEKGEFNFDKVPSSNFSVIVTNIGYRPVAKFIPVNTAEKKIDLGNIIISSMAKVLNEVVIEAAPITIKEDTIEYRADAFKVKENAVVEDLLKKLPGIQVDKDGNIKAQGKAITKVKVNGKDFFGGDPKTATRELPANIVDKVQIIDDYGDQATLSGIKEGTPEKVMNIKLKKDKNTGSFGRVTASVGDQSRYLASFNGNYFNNNQQISVFSNTNNINQSLFSFGNISNRGMGSMMKAGQSMVSDMGGSGSLVSAFSNGDQGFFQGGNNSSDGIRTSNSIGINYRDEWTKRISVYGSYSYNHQNANGDKFISQQNIFNNKTFINNQSNRFENNGDNHRFYFNLEYNIDSFNYIKISPSINYTSTKGVNNTLFDFYKDSMVKTSDGYNNDVVNSTNPNLTATILLNHKFRKRGRNFSANLNVGESDNQSKEDSRNNTVQYISPAGTLQQFYYNSQENQNYNYGLRFTYTEPLSNVRFLDVAYSHNFSYAANDKRLYNINPSTFAKTLVDTLSNNYENNYFTNRANVTIRTTEKKYNYTLGLSVQPVDLRGFSNTKDSAYKPIKRTNIFPVARFTYNFSKSRSLSMNYRGDAQQPSFSQLQDVLDPTNTQYLTHGNPNLKPSINHSINTSYNNFNFISGKVLFTSLSFSTIQNQIVNNVVLLNNAGLPASATDSTSGRQLSTPENVNGYYNASGFYTFSRPYKNRMFVITLNGNLNYNHNINLTNNLKNVGNNWVAGQGLTLEFNYKDWLALSNGVNYSLNKVSYSNAGKGFNNFQNQQYSSWVISSDASINIPKNWVLKYDFDFTINNGLTGDVGKNLAILNASLEKQLFKKKNGIIRLQAYDVFNQNLNISRSVTYNSIIDTRSNRLTRYFMLSFTYRIQKFKGKPSQPKNIGNLNQLRIGG
jgi:hypothetical protein